MRLAGRPKVGLALGGGAARGLAHIGVIRAMVRHGLPIDLVVGTSMGAVMGGAFAATGDISQLESRVRSFVSSDEFRKTRLSFLKETKRERGGLLYSVGNLVRRGIVYGTSTLRGSFLSAERFARSLSAVLPDIEIENLPTPFAAVALDLETARKVILTRGSLRLAASASSAIPGVLAPVPLDGHMLVDGGWIDKVPVLPAYRLGAEVVIAVDITAGPNDVQDHRRGVDVMLRATAIKDNTLVRLSCRFADVVVEPAVKHIHWADFGAVDECIEAGDSAATAMVPKIRHLLHTLRWPWARRSTTARRMAELYLSQDPERGNVLTELDASARENGR